MQQGQFYRHGRKVSEVPRGNHLQKPPTASLDYIAGHSGGRSSAGPAASLIDVLYL